MATQRWAPPAPLAARRHCLLSHPSRAPSACPLPYRWSCCAARQLCGLAALGDSAAWRGGG
eukprot:4811833-Prymnesium_polylepis.1